ncbi:Eukaryotic translation initiation factor 3 subunit I [Trichoplax sp. H2]|nr:Eukaryotic translation initiation factor 3 subunit I [Trichoplax sp. H2]|eukprot:RDD47419.1 Eukaryotic translation initiation factor 3 subunit I [Trichoplax sp. H2]
MRPILLHGHERAITQIRYNREGDLLFSAGKDHSPSVWYSDNGERLGTYDGHSGVVWCINSNWDSTKVVTGSGDNSYIIWDCETGKQLHRIDTRAAVRSCGFSYSGRALLITTDQQRGYESEILLFGLDDPAQINDGEPYLRIPISKDNAKITTAVWGKLDRYLIVGHENGEVSQFDATTGEKLHSVTEHRKAISDINMYKDQSMFVTASKDSTAKLFDADDLTLLKTYKTERPVNSAALSSLKDHVVLGGGQEAIDQTYSIYSSGGEDGYVRVHQFDQSYFDFEFEY